jgi:hypothetical protein
MNGSSELFFSKYNRRSPFFIYLGDTNSLPPTPSQRGGLKSLLNEGCAGRTIRIHILRYSIGYSFLHLHLK